MARINLDNLDTKILQMLVDNGRKPFLEIARECGVSGAAIHQRIAKLQATNILEGSRALIKPTTLGYDTCAFVGVFLKEPSKFNDFVEKLKNVPEVVECHFTTGQYDMLIKMYAHDNEHLLHLIHEKLQPLGLLRTETFVSFREVFSRPPRGQRLKLREAHSHAIYLKKHVGHPKRRCAGIFSRGIAFYIVVKVATAYSRTKRRQWPKV